MQNKLEILQPDTFYHIYNRANGNEQLFLSDENYLFFLRKYKEYISPICHSYCYCLMPNHFHFLVEVKSTKELEDYFNQKTPLSITLQGLATDELETFPKFKTLEMLISKQFSNFFSCYTQAFNKQQNRMGSLFMKNFKRKKITDTKYLMQLVQYIHRNPLEANLCNELHLWNYSSYGSLLSNKETLLMRNQVLEWFNDVQNFEYVHKLSLTNFEIEHHFH